MNTLLKTIFGIFCLFLPVLGEANSWVNEPGEKAYDLRHHEIRPVDGSLKKPAIHFLRNYLEHVDGQSASLALTHKRKSPMGHHLTFVQIHQGLPIYGSEVKLNLSRDYEILSLYHKTLPTADWRLKPFDQEVFDSLFAEDQSTVPLQKREEVIYFDEGKAQSALKARLNSTIPKEVIFSREGQVLYEKELVRRAGPDTTLHAFVFLPDPLTTAGVNYGSPYVNARDSNIQELNAERKVLVLRVNEVDPDTFFLEGPHVKIVDTTFPSNPPAFTTNEVFDYKRGEPQFEEVNVYYHLSRFADYVQNSLGISGLGDYQINADAHGMPGDNSTFELSGDSTGFLRFGDGGVDDGEDADIVIHEYAHALSYHAEPDFPARQWESEGLEEGIADYLACSYSRQLNEYGWERLFNWDGHNEFWNGRSCTTNKHYPEDLTRNIYSDGTLWAGRMMKIREALGRTVTDRLMLVSLYNYSATMTMSDAARQLILAEKALYQKKHRSELAHHLDQAGFVDASEFTGIESDRNQVPEIEVYNKGRAFEIQSEHSSKNWHVRLQSINGKTLGNWDKRNLKSFEISHAHLARGVYLVSVHSGRIHQTFRVVK